MSFTGYRFASSVVRMSSHMVSEPWGEVPAGFHRGRTSRGALGSTSSAGGGTPTLHKSFHCLQNHLRHSKERLKPLLQIAQSQATALTYLSSKSITVEPISSSE
jgi:hypothetical protein